MMIYMFKRKFLLIGLLGALLGLGQAYADDYVDFWASNSHDSCEPACCECCDNWLFNADLLYWRGMQNGQECACGPDIKNRWNLGYRIGLENDAFFDCWDVAVYWTNLHSHSHQRDNDDDHASWKLNYDTVDILFGHQFNTDCCFTYTPFVGLRGAWIDERLRAHFADCDCDDDVASGGVTDQLHKERFWGVGPEIGIKADWDIGSGFSVYGGLGVGILYGNFKINVHDVDTIPDATDSGNFCVHRNFNTCQVIADISIGVQWKFCVCDKVAVVRLGLEHHRYFNQNQIGGYGDLCLDGVSLSAGINF